ncbi:MAG: hypothetical protein M3Y75_13075 [Actinomycetota bacterium]|nr:hypothetical protein [Actinomycetota bacterium]
MSEARELTEERIQKLAALPVEELLRYEEQPVKERLIGPSGKAYRSHAYAFWDMEPDDSSLIVRVDLRGRGLRWWRRYHGVYLYDPEPGPDEPPYEPDVSSTWTENCACLGLALIVLGLPLSLVYAIRRLLG